MSKIFFIFIGLSLPYLLSASQQNIQMSLPLTLDGSTIKFSQVINNQDSTPSSLIRLASSMIDPNKITPQMTAYGLNLFRKFVRYPIPVQQKRETYKIASEIDGLAIFQNKKKQQQYQQLHEKQNRPNNSKSSKNVLKSSACLDNQTIHKQNADLIVNKPQKADKLSIQQKNGYNQQNKQKCHKNKQVIQCKPQQSIKYKEQAVYIKQENNENNKKQAIKQKDILKNSPIQQNDTQTTQENKNNYKNSKIVNNQEQNKKQQDLVNNKVIDEPKVHKKQNQKPKTNKKAKLISNVQPINNLAPPRFIDNRKHRNFNSNQLFPEMPNFNFDMPQTSDSKEFSKGWKTYEGHNMINGQGNYIKGQANQINGHGNVVICP